MLLYLFFVIIKVKYQEPLLFIGLLSHQVFLSTCEIGRENMQYNMKSSENQPWERDTEDMGRKEASSDIKATSLESMRCSKKHLTQCVSQPAAL